MARVRAGPNKHIMGANLLTRSNRVASTFCFLSSGNAARNHKERAMLTPTLANANDVISQERTTVRKRIIGENDAIASVRAKP